ncbi:hypothetical protein AQUCO_00900956v1 [Aquilegia coerulea]|uniref:HTH myb-type domain-containing protein n=3 Tax=Aquilegia coerulea TaxID=218851 RepID=A0A2G5EGB2_AQUCA|nr:hypothetical protein AQUCO_00900956v1 [Aquilegia coerulea]PIA54732.1 hypothetical protein AQUCO_00900956v1 [Aquilegia coerulea]
MVLQKRLDYGFNGFQVPSIPKGSRSARGRRGVHKKKVVDNQMCAFELLATVAGKLLQERESTPVSSNVSTGKLLQDRESTPASSNVSAGRAQSIIIKGIVKKEQPDEHKPLKVEPCDQGSCDESVFASELSLQAHNESYNSTEFPHFRKDACSAHLSRLPEDPVCGKSRKEVGISNKVKRSSPGYAESYKGKVGEQKAGSMLDGNVPDMCSSEDPTDMDTKPPTALVSSDSSVKVPLCKDPIAHDPFPRYHDDVKVGSKDDDENSSGCTQPSTVTLKTFRAPSRIGDRRIRKLLASRYWRVAPKLKDGELSNSDGDMKPVFRKRKTCYTRQRSQRNFPFKKRKLYEQSSVSTSNRVSSSEGICNSSKRVIKENVIDVPSNGASGESSSAAVQESSFESRDSHVKLSIKSFKIPELFIEIPESATVGSLKRTVMEAVTAILGGGLHVGVLLQGKKIRDDNKTLLQTGISHGNKLDGLGFALEPNAANSPPSICPEDPPFLLPCDSQTLTRYPITPTSGASDASLNLTTNNLTNYMESDHDSVPTPTDMSIDKTPSDSRALVAVPAMSVEALAVVPLNRKSRRTELAQRRIRRPFSVSEVEALVQAVEKLGTGRWRDVKLRAFDNAKHRTYVDLKDKWKTLVHTARISPQQRRGEPVPQELLDRVLAAHAYWSQQQAKQQVKPQTEMCLLT